MTEHAITLFTKKHAAIVRVYDRSSHSVFAPSGSSMWANCSGSLVPNLYAKDNAGEEAAEGTVAHSVAEEWLKSGERPDHLVGTVVTVNEGEEGEDVAETFHIEIDESMLDYIQEYVDWVECLPGEHFVETRVDFSDLTPIPNQRGTADHAACEPRVLTITDLKYGKGVQVYAEENTQGLLYAYGFFRQYDHLYHFEKIIIRIAQPRLDHFDVWEIDRATLLDRAAWLKERAYAAWCPDAPRSPGKKQCQFCRIKSDCAAYVVFMERLLDDIFPDLDAPITPDDMNDLTQRLDAEVFDLKPPIVGSLTVAHKATLLPYRKMIEDFFNQVAEDLQRRAKEGAVIPGHKLVAGRNARDFYSVTEAAEHLAFLGLDEDVIHPRGMISPAKSETALTKIGYKRKHLPGLLGSVVRKLPGAPTLVAESDRRPAISAVTDDVFGNLDDDDL